MKSLSLFAFVMLASIGVAFGQDKEEISKWEFYGGYSAVRGEHEAGASGRTLQNSGFDVSATRRISRYFGLKLDYGRNSRSESIDLPINGGITVRNKFTSQLYTAGVQVKDYYGSARVKPFAHVMLGAVSSRVEAKISNCPANLPFCDNKITDTSLAATLGGGIDIKINKRFSVRPLQVDYVWSRKALPTATEKNNVRLGAGIVVHVDNSEVQIAPRSSKFKKYEIHGGYVFNKFEDAAFVQPVGKQPVKGIHGYNASIKWNFHRFLGAEFEQSSGWAGLETYPTAGVVFTVRRSLYSYTGGIQVKDNASKSRFKPFAHALFGGSTMAAKASFGTNNVSMRYVSNQSAFTMIFGGGVDVRLNDKFSVRAFQFDYVHPRVDQLGVGTLAKSYRFGTGIVFH